jgi:hypothetical protein
MGVYQGLRPAHLQAYLDEFVLRSSLSESPVVWYHAIMLPCY